MARIEWDQEKVLLVVMAALIVALGGFIAWKEREIAQLVKAMPGAENQLAGIGKRYTEIGLLEREREKDELAKGVTPIDYLYTQMTQSGIGRRAFSIESPSNPDKQEGYKDSDWELRVKQGEKAFSREAIAKLLLYIEASTSRMKVTKLRLSMDMSKGAQPDHWEPLVTITDREPVAVEP